MTACALYRHFDFEGRLLYVGISVSPMSRLGSHIDGSSWAKRITRVEIEWLDSEDEARTAERRAIRAERPEYNLSQALSGDAAKDAVVSISDALGSAQIEAALRVTSHSVRHARVSGRFPARWYAVLSRLCDEAGIDCPLCAFAWIEAPRLFSPIPA